MMETYGQWSPVDGESSANGKERDVAIIVETEDIFEALAEYLETKEPNISDKIDIYGHDVEIDNFLTEDDLREFDEGMNYFLDDEYGSAKHLEYIARFLTEHVAGDSELHFDYTERI